MEREPGYSAQNPYQGQGYGQGHGQSQGRDSTVPPELRAYVGRGTLDPRARLSKYRPTLVKHAAAWTGVVLGIVMLSSIFTSVSGASGEIVSEILMSVGLAIMTIAPGVYWLLCNRRDARTVKQWLQTNQDYRVNWQMLASDERAVFARPEELPVLPQRHWKSVWLVILAGFLVAMVGGMLNPESTTA
ncbi:hypothetical protein ACT3SZ_08125 [Corynebacterium sp. AOP40-9SA-29]|uniref:hypothetical protein n=1 Tax=Corynebacterium sp. AOP40-9SA-29 TaxID=3457677 RepID=UPI0040348870